MIAIPPTQRCERIRDLIEHPKCIWSGVVDERHSIIKLSSRSHIHDYSDGAQGRVKSSRSSDSCPRFSSDDGAKGQGSLHFSFIDGRFGV